MFQIHIFLTPKRSQGGLSAGIQQFRERLPEKNKTKQTKQKRINKLTRYASSLK